MHIRKLVSGRYQCIIRLQGVSTSKTFQDKQSAKIWGQRKELAIYSGTPHQRNNKERPNLNYREVNIVKYESSSMTRKTIKETMNRNHYSITDSNQKELNEGSSGFISEEERVLAGKRLTSFISKLDK